MRVEHELVSQKFNETRVHENTGTDGVENTVGKLLVGGVGGLGANTGCNTDGGRDGEADSQGVWHPLAFGRPRGDSEAGSQTKTLEHLVEDKDDQENDQSL